MAPGLLLDLRVVVNADIIDECGLGPGLSKPSETEGGGPFLSSQDSRGGSPRDRSMQPVTKGCFRSDFAEGRSAGFRARHMRKKSTPADERAGGNLG